MEEVKERLESLDEKFEYLSKLPAEVRRRLKALAYFDEKHDELDNKFHVELMNLERKYFGLRKPLYKQRSEIIQGLREPTDEEIILDEEDEGEDRIAEVETKGDVKGIPDFWLHVLKNHPLIGELITEEDEPALKSLLNVEISYLDEAPGFNPEKDCSGYKIDFTFGKNDYFNNSVLTKTYFIRDCGEEGNLEVVYDHAEATAIDWKANKNLCEKVVTKMQRKRGSTQTRTVKKTVPNDSFFNFFNPPVVPSEEDEISDNEAEMLDEKLEADFEMGEILKTKVVPRALDWYTGRALEMEDNFDDEEFDEEDECGEGCEHDHGDDDDDLDDDESPLQHQTGSTQQKPECKQQ